MKRISILDFGALLVLAGTPAAGQDFTAGKTPAQLFGSDCAECHRTPNGLAKGRDVKTLAGFLREHYTTKSDTAGALAAYVSGFAGSGPADVRNRAGVGPSPPAPSERADRRNRRDGEAAALGDDAGPGAKSPEDQRARRRQRTVNLSGDGEKRRVRDDADTPRPPTGVAAAPPAVPARTAARTADTAPREAADPLSRLRPYLASGLGYEGTIAEAAKAGHSSSRKRQGRDAGPAPPDAPPPAKADPSPAPPTAPPGATAAAAPAESTATMPALAPAAAPAPAPVAAPAPTAPAAVVTPPRLGQ